MAPCFEGTFGFLGAGKTGETGCSVHFKKRSMIEDIRLWLQAVNKNNYGNKLILIVK